MGFPNDSMGREFAYNAGDMREMHIHTQVRKISWKGKWQPTPLFLPGKSHGQRSPVGYSPQGRKESGTTERLNNNIGRDCFDYWLLENWWLFYILNYVSFTDDGLLAYILQYSWHILLVNIVKCLFFLGAWFYSRFRKLCCFQKLVLVIVFIFSFVFNGKQPIMNS